MAEPDRLQCANAPPLPAPASDRLIAIDILRGLALFGVMAINVVFEFRVSIFRQFLPSFGTMSRLDGTAFLVGWSPRLSAFLMTLFGDSPFNRGVETLLDRTISLKAFALFSLLFGLGLAMQFERLGQDRRAALLLRRLLVLLLFGLFHLTLIWNGDILTEYALAGLLVLPVLFAPRWLLAVSSLALLGIYLAGLLAWLMPLPDAAWFARRASEATLTYGSGGFGDILAFRIREIAAIAPLHLWILPRTLGLFLLGAFIWRSGVLQQAGKLSGWFVFAGLAALIASIDAGPSLAPVALALAYGAIILGIASTPLGARLLGWAAPLGRMAFTNYLMQSLIFGAIFYGYGLGLFGRLSVSAALGIGIIVYIAQVVASRWWLARFNFGPVEWLWRTLMYGRMQPMRRVGAPIEPSYVISA
jgi:uncharacterized protein